jgi:phage FluMu protein Com
MNSTTDLRCTCGKLLCKEAFNGFLEYKLQDKNVHIIFPFGIVQCVFCEKIWIVQPFEKIREIENKLLDQEILNLNLNYL